LFTPGDVAALTRLLTNYVADTALVRRHAHQARERAVEQFGLAGMVGRYQAVYDELCRTVPSTAG
jgi:glycosyltransferase involved in cell wall biosynthesis